MSLKVLIVDDAPEVREVVRAALEREGIDVVEAEDGAQALERARRSRPAVAVLDVGLPDMSGIELLAALREEQPGLHIIMLTAARSEDDRVEALMRGADDYVIKPFSHRELVARVLSAGRRLRGADAAVIEHGGLRIDTVAHEVTIDGRPLELTPKEYDLLIFLAAHPRRTFTRDQLLHQVWASSSDWQAPTTVTEHVRRLRSKIEPDPDTPERIVTVRAVGYRYEPAEPDAGRQGAAGGDVAPDDAR